MLDKREYLNLKKEIKCLCCKNILKLCEDMELNEEEKEMLMYFYDGKSRARTCIDLCISSTYYSEHMKILFNKINDYKNTLK